MLSIEYIWSALAITQALVVTLQVGSKLLLPSPSPITDTTDLSSPIILNNNNITHNTTTHEIIQRNVISLTKLQQQKDDDDHIDQKNCDDENDSLLSAFRLAVRIGSLSSSYHNPMMNDSDTLELELMEHDAIDRNRVLQNSHCSSRSVTVRRCYREMPSSPTNIEPYRMSMVPAFRPHHNPPSSMDATIANTTNATMGSNEMNNITTNTKNETDVIITTPRKHISNDTTRSLLLHEYYETQCTIVQNDDNTTTTKHHYWNDGSTNQTLIPTLTTCYRIRAYAPQIFHQLRSYYDNNNKNDNNTRSHPSRNEKQQGSVSFEESILNRLYTFLKTNSKGSQRSKNIFFYTNGSTINHVGRRNKYVGPSKELHVVPNYLIKSIKNDEFHTLMNTILPKYVTYMEQYGSISLLNRIYGIYEITIQHDTDPSNDQQSSHGTNDDDDDDDSSINTASQQQKHQQRYYLVVFNAVFDPSLITTSNVIRNEHPSSTYRPQFRVYDVKGSTVGRQAKTTNDATRATNHMNETSLPLVESSPSVTYKDLDLIQDIKYNNYNNDNNTDSNNTATSSIRLMQLNPIAKDQILQQLRNDVNFLTSCSVMDYSLLIGIEQLRNDVERQRTTQIRNSFWKRRRWNWNGDNRNLNTGTSPLSVQYGTTNDPTHKKYYLGVIDFLQPYNYKKEIEYRWKSLIYKKNAYSCIPPDLYAQRFLDFIDEYVM